MNKAIKKTIEYMDTKIKKVLRWARFHKPENFCRSSYITNQDKYYFEFKDRIGLSGTQRAWELHREVL